MADKLFELTVKAEDELPAEIQETGINIVKGDIFTSKDEKIRVIDVREAGVMVIDLNNNKIYRMEFNQFFSMVESGEYKKEAVEPVKFIELSKEDIAKIREQKEILEKILEEFYPKWDLIFRNGIVKPSCYLAAEKMSISSRQFRNIMKTYLRSGRDMYSLADQRKFNSRPEIKPTVDVNPRKDTKLLFEFALSEFKRTSSVQAAYDNLMRTYFREPVIVNGVATMKLVPADQITVSYKQVYGYISSHLGGLTISQWKKGRRDVMNNERLLPGDVRYGVSRLGQRYEADECELPCYIIDPDTGEVVGKAIMYVIVDDKAGIITGCYVGYDNNSCNGIRQAMLSMLEPHINQTIRYNMTYTEDEFPSMALPDEIRCDHGAEYESHSLTKAFGELGITLSLVPVACGSFKGLVESINNQIQVNLKAHAVNEGVVKKQYRGGDIAKGNACMTLEDLREIVYTSILYINRRIIPDYNPDLEQMKEKIAATPASIYTFEKKRSGDPRNVNDANRDRILFMLLARDKDKRRFSIGREGIRYRNHPLCYFSTEPWFEDMLLDKKYLDKIEVRYDDTNIGCVYVCYKGIVHKVPLSAKRESQKTLIGLDWDTYDRIYKEYKESESNVEAKEESYNRKLEMIDKIEDIAGTARVLNGPGQKYGKAPKEARKAARQKLRKDPNEIINRMYGEVDEENEETKETSEKLFYDEKTGRMLDEGQLELKKQLEKTSKKLPPSIEEEREQHLRMLAKYGPNYRSAKEQSAYLARLIGAGEEEEDDEWSD